MRFGNWRGVTLALALVSALATFATTASANPFHHDIPRLVPAVDANGGPYYAPPVPYGHYAGKDIPGQIHKGIGGLKGGLLGKLHGLGGHGCGDCGGSGCGSCEGTGHGHGGDACGGKGCGLFKKHGHKSHGVGPCGDGGCGDGPGFATTGVHGSAQQVIVSSPQGPIPSAQCGDPGCGLKGGHGHEWGHGGCGDCGGSGCDSCAGGIGDPCGGCGGKGCGLCGFLGHIKNKLCGGCGGLGCGLCGKAKSLLGGLLHKDKIKYFVGPGGPVPITPGYVPYVIPTRSPRDFLAFPPFTP